MCLIEPFITQCCGRTYIKISKVPSCPDAWPKAKCPPELCIQLGQTWRSDATCWRCQADIAILPEWQREQMRPGIDKAYVVRGLEEIGVAGRKQRVEEGGHCWFCHARGGCKACGADEIVPGERLERSTAGVQTVPIGMARGKGKRKAMGFMDGGKTKKAMLQHQRQHVRQQHPYAPSHGSTSGLNHQQDSKAPRHSSELPTATYRSVAVPETWPQNLNPFDIGSSNDPFALHRYNNGEEDSSSNIQPQHEASSGVLQYNAFNGGFRGGEDHLPVQYKTSHDVHNASQSGRRYGQGQYNILGKEPTSSNATYAPSRQPFVGFDYSAEDHFWNEEKQNILLHEEQLDTLGEQPGQILLDHGRPFATENFVDPVLLSTSTNNDNQGDQQAMQDETSSSPTTDADLALQPYDYQLLETMHSQGKLQQKNLSAANAQVPRIIQNEWKANICDGDGTEARFATQSASEQCD